MTDTDTNQAKTLRKADLMALPYDDFVKLLLRDPREYAQELTVPKLDLMHAVVGLGSEICELAQARAKPGHNMLEELGDLAFYQQCIHNAAEIPFREDDALQMLAADITSDVVGYAAAIEPAMDAVKRHIFYSLGLDRQKIVCGLQQGWTVIRRIAEASGWTLKQVLNANQDKLSTRFDGKFSVGAVVERDLEAEKKVLEAHA